MKKINKSSREELEEKLHEILIEEIGEEYRFLWKSDDSGIKPTIMFEEVCPDLAIKKLLGRFMGWDLILVTCPKGYLEIFHPIESFSS
jgi:hypothetical protein